MAGRQIWANVKLFKSFLGIKSKMLILCRKKHLGEFRAIIETELPLRRVVNLLLYVGKLQLTTLSSFMPFYVSFVIWRPRCSCV